MQRSHDARFASLTTENLFVRQGKKRIQDRRDLYYENLSKQQKKVTRLAWLNRFRAALSYKV